MNFLNAGLASLLKRKGQIRAHKFRKRGCENNYICRMSFRGLDHRSARCNNSNTIKIIKKIFKKGDFYKNLTFNFNGHFIGAKMYIK